MFAGSCDWLVREDLMSLPATLDCLIGTMEGWEDWLPDSRDTWKANVLLEACSYGICSIVVPRKQVLSPHPSGAKITLQQLEADGVIELMPEGTASPILVSVG